MKKLITILVLILLTNLVLSQGRRDTLFLQSTLNLTTLGTSGPATLLGATLNIPVYSAGGGGGTPAGSNEQLQYNNSGVFGASSSMTFDGTALNILGSTSNTTFNVGSLGLQSYSLNNSWFGDNIYYNSGFRARATGYGALVHLQDNEIQLIGAASVTAGSLFTSIMPLKTNGDGTVAIGGNIAAATATYTGSTMLANLDGVAIGNNGTVAAASSILDITSTTKGVLLPRQTAAQRLAISSPPTYLMGIDTDSSRVYVKQASGWKMLAYTTDILSGGSGGSSQWRDTTNGIYLPDGKNVGIGTVNPISLLSLRKDQASGTGITIRNSSSSAGAESVIGFVNDLSAAAVLGIYGSATSFGAITAGSMYQYYDGNGKMIYANSGTGPITWATRNGLVSLSDKMILAQDGTLSLTTYGTGIHTGTAARSLQVDAGGNIIEGLLGASSQWRDTTIMGNAGIYYPVNEVSIYNRLLVKNGIGGTMAFPYEAIISQSSGDNKLGIYTSNASPVNVAGASLAFGFTNFVNVNGRFPGFEIQNTVGGTSVAENTLSITSLERDNPTGAVAASKRAMTINGIGQIGIGINIPANGSIVDISSTVAGLLIPRMTIAERNSLATTSGLLVTLTDSSNRLSTYTGSVWRTYAFTGESVSLSAANTYTNFQTYQGTAASDGGQLSVEVAGVTGSGTNWTLAGTNLNVGGYTHTTGSTTPLTTALAAVSGVVYQIVLTITGRTAGTVTVTFGGVTSSAFSASSYSGPMAISTGTLSVTPTSTFDGTVVISLKAVNISTANVTWKNSSGTTVNELRAYDGANVVIGTLAGRRMLPAYATNNVAVGSSTLAFTSVGFGNTAVGGNTLAGNTNGSVNTAVGFSALYSNIVDNGNVGIGADALYYNTSGSTNVAIGWRSGKFQADGTTPLASISNSILIGYNAKTLANGETNVILIGTDVTSLGSNSTAIGTATTTKTKLYGIVAEGSGAAVASAAAIVPTGNVFHVTGTTTITSITATNVLAGAVITIIFDGALTFTNGSNLKIGSDFVTTADDSITLRFDGTNFYQVSRSVN